MPRINESVNAGSVKNPTGGGRYGSKVPTVPGAQPPWICTDCGVGELFLDLNKNGTFSTMCDMCTLFVPTPAEPPTLTAPDVPSPLVFFRTAEKDVYRALRAIRSEENPATVKPADICEWLRDWYAEQEPNPLKRKEAPRVTVSHALTKLARTGFVQRATNGWVVCKSNGENGGAL